MSNFGQKRQKIFDVPCVPPDPKANNQSGSAPATGGLRGGLHSYGILKERDVMIRAKKSQLLYEGGS